MPEKLSAAEWWLGSQPAHQCPAGGDRYQQRTLRVSGKGLRTPGRPKPGNRAPRARQPWPFCVGVQNAHISAHVPHATWSWRTAQVEPEKRALGGRMGSVMMGWLRGATAGASRITF